MTLNKYYSLNKYKYLIKMQKYISDWVKTYDNLLNTEQTDEIIKLLDNNTYTNII
jgi:hypothetical protein